MISILHQLVGCEKLRRLQFWDTDLRKVEEDLVEVLKDLPSEDMRFSTKDANLSETFFKRLEKASRSKVEKEALIPQTK